MKGLADTALPLFAVANRDGAPQPELAEPMVRLTPMVEGREVVEDYRSTELTSGQHPVTFPRPSLRERGMVACGDLSITRDGRRVMVPGIMLMGQRPCSVK